MAATLSDRASVQANVDAGIGDVDPYRFEDRQPAEDRDEVTVAAIARDPKLGGGRRIAIPARDDRYGHQAGDECLKLLAAALRSCCRRPADMVARYGGEEFAMILPDTELAGAAHVAEAARDAVAQLTIAHDRSAAAAYVTISGGVAVLRTIDITSQQLITAADQALYQAKHLGRNRMISAPAEL